MFHKEHIVMTNRAIQYCHDIEVQQNKAQEGRFAKGKNRAATRVGVG